MYNLQKAKSVWNPMEVYDVERGMDMRVLETADLKLMILTAREQSFVYELSPSGTLTFRQALPVHQPLSLAVYNYLGKGFLAVSMATDVDIYLWQGRHFNSIQTLPFSDIESMEFFTLGNVLYLVAVSDLDDNESYTSTCGVWRKHLEADSFECLQKLTEEPALGVRYFHTNVMDLEEHFLAVTFRDENPVVFKFDGEKFQPFQVFNSSSALQWMPVQGAHGEFSLILSTLNDVRTFGYDGWRFQQGGLTLNAGVFGYGVKNMKTLQRAGDSLLFITNQQNHMSSSSIVKLIYSRHDDIMAALPSLETWCSKRSLAYPEPLEALSTHMRSSSPISEIAAVNGTTTLRHAIVSELIVEKGFGILNANYVDRVEEVAEGVDGIEKIMSNVHDLLEAVTPGVTVFEGPITLKYLQLSCDEYSPCSFSDMSAVTLNGERVDEIFKQTVRLDEEIQKETILEFHKLRAETVAADYLNSHPARELISRVDSSILRKRLAINGTAAFEGRVAIGEDIGGVLLDREHALIMDEDQVLAGKLLLKSGSVDALTINGVLNGADVRKAKDPRASFKLRNFWENLDILDLEFSGVLLNEDASNVLDSSLLTAENDEMMVDELNVLDGKLSGIDITDFVRIDEGKYNVKGLKLMRPATVGDLYVSGALNGNPLADLLDLIKDRPISAREDFVLTLVSNSDCDKVMIRDDIDSGNEYTESDSVVTEFYGPIKVKSLTAHHLKVTGKIGNVNWTKLVEDAVVEGEETILSGRKTVEGPIEVDELSVAGYINDLSAVDNASDASSLFHDGDLVLNDTLTVQRIIAGSLTPQTIQSMAKWNNNITFESGLDVAVIDNVNISRLLTETVSIDEAATLKSLTFIDGLTVHHINISELLNGVKFEKVVLLRSSDKLQQVDGSWLLDGGLTVAGNLSIKGVLNGMNVSSLCNMSMNSPKVIVSGSVTSQKEPVISKSVNYHKLEDLMSHLWFRDQPAVIPGNIDFHRVKSRGKTFLHGLVNGVNLTNLPTGYLSKTVTRIMRAPLYVRNLTVVGITSVDKIEGKVNGLNIGEFAKNVLQRGVDQRFTAMPTFQEIVVPTLGGNYTVNGLNLAADLLRYDTDKAVMSAKKTVYNLMVNSVNVSEGVSIQNVDVGAWNKQAFILGRDTTYKGNLSLTNVEFDTNLRVKGMLGPVKFDKEHILTSYGAQQVSGKKVISGSVAASSLIVDGQTNGIDLNNFLPSIVHKNTNVTVTVPVTLNNIQSKSMDLDGAFGGVNVSNMCVTVENARVVHDLDRKFADVMESAQKIRHKISNGAYFLDYYRVAQKLTGNVTGVTAFPVKSSESALMVTQRSTKRFTVEWMSWDSHDSKFKLRREPAVNFTSDIVSVANGIVLNRTFVFVEFTSKISKLFLDDGQVLEASPASNVTCVGPVYIPQSDVCLFVGQNDTNDALLCKQNNSARLDVFQRFNTSKCIQVASVITGDKTWLAVIGQKQSKSLQDIVFLTMYSFDATSMSFHPRQVLAVLNPVAVSTISYHRYHYLAVASPHQPESVRSSVLSLFRYHSKTDKWIRYQEIPLEAPLDVEFALLPSGQLALYAITANPTRVFVVYLFRGVAGFVEETAGFTIYAGQKMSIFNVNGNHFVGITGQNHAQVIMAEFRGKRFG